MSRADIAWALAEFSEEDKVRLYHRYYDGEHKAPYDLSTESYRRDFKRVMQSLVENLCPVVVDAPVERLSIAEWSDERAQLAFESVDGDKLANELHRRAGIGGESYVLVWENRLGEVKAYPHDGDAFVTDEDHVTGKLRVAAKRWCDGKTHRLNLYYPDVVERYYSSGDEAKKPDGWREWTQDGDPAVIRHRFGVVPVVEFERDASELRDVLPLQDALNKLCADVIIGSEFFAQARIVFTGVDASDTDELTGMSDTRAQYTEAQKSTAWRELELSGDAAVTKIPGEDMTKIDSICESFERKIAKVTGVPLHFFQLGSGQFPSGDALRAAESRLNAKVRDMQQDFGGSWHQLMLLLGVDALPVWEDPTALSDIEKLTVLETKQRLGVPQRQLWREMGYTDEQIALMETDLADSADMLSRALNAG